MELRKYKPSDCAILTNLFYQTVHCVNSKDYSEEQLNAWVDGNIDLAKWNNSFSSHHTVVAIENDTIVGFGDIDDSCYLDRLYVHKDYQHMGIATAICDYLESFAIGRKITTHASITAKPFFLQRGYTIVKEQEVIRRGVAMRNFIMEKSNDNT